MNIKTPQTDIEVFLYNEINIEIFEDFESNEFEDISTLDFFNLLYSEFEFYLNNSEKYLTIKEHFENLIFVQPLFENNTVYHDFFYWITQIIKLEFEANGTSKIEQKTYNFLENYYLDIKYSYVPAERLETFANNSPWDFQETKKALSKIENNKEKINYLIEQKTDFKQCDENWSAGWGEVSFDKKCDLEIKKLKELLELEPQQNTTPTISNSLKWHGTQTAFIELVQALILTKTITAKSNKEIITTLSNVFNFKVTNPDKTFNDIKATRNNGTETLFLDELKATLYNHIQEVGQKKNR